MKTIIRIIFLSFLPLTFSFNTSIAYYLRNENTTSDILNTKSARGYIQKINYKFNVDNLFDVKRFRTLFFNELTNVLSSTFIYPTNQKGKSRIGEITSKEKVYDNVDWSAGYEINELRDKIIDVDDSEFLKTILVSLQDQDQDAKLSEILEGMGYPSVRVPGLVKLFNALFEEIDYASFKERLQTKDADELMQVLIELMKVLQQKGQLSAKNPSPIGKYLVGARNLINEDILNSDEVARLSVKDQYAFGCADQSVLAYILLNLAGVEVKNVHALLPFFNVTHQFVYIPSHQIVVDMAYKYVRRIDIFKYYQQKELGWALKQRIPMADLKKKFIEGQTDVNTLTDEELLNIFSTYMIVSNSEEGVTAGILNNLGHLYNHLKRYIDALQDLQEALKIEPGTAGMDLDYGVAYFAQGKVITALKAYQKVLDFAPDNVFAFGNMGLAYKKLDRLADSKKMFDEVLKYVPNEATSVRNIKEIQTKLEEDSKIVKMLEKDIKAGKKTGIDLVHLADAYFHLGKYTEAEKYYREAKDLAAKETKEDIALASYQLGSALYALEKGDDAEKIALFIEAIKNYPQAKTKIPGELEAQILAGLEENDITNLGTWEVIPGTVGLKPPEDKDILTYYSWIEGSFNLTEYDSLRIYFSPNDAGKKFMVRFLPAGTPPDYSTGLDTTVRVVPSNGIVVIPLSASPLKSSKLKEIGQISIHSGEKAWAYPVGGQNANVHLVFEKIEGLRKGNVKKGALGNDGTFGVLVLGALLGMAFKTFSKYLCV